MTTLKNCPFCAGNAVKYDDDSYGTGFIMCSNDKCKVELHVAFNTGDDKEAIKIWNKRGKGYE